MPDSTAEAAKTELEDVLASFKRMGFAVPVRSQDADEPDDPPIPGMPHGLIRTRVELIDWPGDFELCFDEGGNYLGLYDDYFGSWKPRGAQ